MIKLILTIYIIIGILLATSVCIYNIFRILKKQMSKGDFALDMSILMSLNFVFAFLLGYLN